MVPTRYPDARGSNVPRGRLVASLLTSPEVLREIQQTPHDAEELLLGKERDPLPRIVSLARVIEGAVERAAKAPGGPEGAEAKLLATARERIAAFENRAQSKAALQGLVPNHAETYDRVSALAALKASGAALILEHAEALIRMTEEDRVDHIRAEATSMLGMVHRHDLSVMGEAGMLKGKTRYGQVALPAILRAMDDEAERVREAAAKAVCNALFYPDLFMEHASALAHRLQESKVHPAMAAWLDLHLEDERGLAIIRHEAWAELPDEVVHAILLAACPDAGLSALWRISFDEIASHARVANAHTRKRAALDHWRRYQRFRDEEADERRLDALSDEYDAALRVLRQLRRGGGNTLVELSSKAAPKCTCEGSRKRAVGAVQDFVEAARRVLYGEV